MTTMQMYFGADGHLTEEATALYVDALKLNCLDRMPGNIREHVSNCQRCKREIIELESLVDDRQYQDVRSHPTFGVLRTKRKFLMVYRIAASILIVVSLGSAAYLLGLFDRDRTGRQTRSTEQSVQGVQTDSSKMQTTPERFQSTRREEQLTANFTPSPNLEGVVNSQFRSEDVRVISPSKGEVVRGKVSFRWEAGVKPPFILKILNNREVEKKKVTLRNPRYVLREELADGLYYWKLEADGKLLYVGKFLVKGR